MEKYFFISILKRIFTSTVMLFLIITILFFLLRSAPGDPAQKYLNPALSPLLNEKISESFKLNEGLLQQYGSFIVNFVKGDFGISYTYRIPVTEVLKEYLPFTVFFSFSAIILQLAASFLFFAITLKFKSGIFDRMFSSSLIILYLIPTYLLGIFLIYFFSVKLKLFPSSGLSSINTGDMSGMEVFFDYLRHMALPLLTISASGLPVFYKYIKDTYNEVRSRKFIISLKAAGVNERNIVLRHILPNLSGVLISVTAVELGTLLGGALLTEVLFGLPGMGRLAYSAVLSRDYPLITACSFMAAFFVVVCSLAADIIKAFIDKRFLSRGILN